MPEEMMNFAASGEWKLVPMAQLKKWRRELDACQKVMWLRGGFDPAYCLDAQDCLKEMEGVLAASVPPTGGEPGAVEGLRQLVIGSYPDPDVEGAHDEYLDEHQSQALWLLRNAGRIETHVTRLQAENAALQQRLNVADQRVDELEAELTKAKRGYEWESQRSAALLEELQEYEGSSGSLQPSLKENQGIPGTSFQRLNQLANEGE